jgi:cyclopropane fatty-acyl-phospholipid synthase-like methyltransferase
MHLDLYDDTYDAFCDLLPNINSNVLEIACGPGNITKYLLTKRPGLKILGTDFAPNMIALAKENNPTAVFQIIDCREIDQLTQKFDGIMCGFCLPYLSKEEVAKLFKDSAHLLNNGGIAYFSAIEGDYEKSAFEYSSDGQHKTFVYYYAAEFLRGLLEENNFEMAELVRKEYPKGETISTHLIFIAKKVSLQ